MLTILLVAVGGILAVAFVLAPLLQREEDIKPIRRPRPGMRHLHGLESKDVDIPDADERRCPHCGATVEEAFDFCGQCGDPVP